METKTGYHRFLNYLVLYLIVKMGHFKNWNSCWIEHGNVPLVLTWYGKYFNWNYEHYLIHSWGKFTFNLTVNFAVQPASKHYTWVEK